MTIPTNSQILLNSENPFPALNSTVRKLLQASYYAHTWSSAADMGMCSLTTDRTDVNSSNSHTSTSRLFLSCTLHTWSSASCYVWLKLSVQQHSNSLSLSLSQRLKRHGSYLPHTQQSPTHRGLRRQRHQHLMKMMSMDLPKPTDWFSKLASLQIRLDLQLLCHSLRLPFSPSCPPLPSPTTKPRRPKKPSKLSVHQVPSTITLRQRPPPQETSDSGFSGPPHVCMVLVTVLLLSALFGIGLVNLWVEEPVFVRERLHFDYTEPHPTAVFAFGSADGIYQDIRVRILGSM